MPFGTKGSWRFQVQIGGGYTLEASNDDTWLVLGGVGFSYFVMENFSLDFEVVYYVLSPNYNVYMDIQQAINLSIHEKFEKEGIEFAYPTQTLFIEKPE